MNTRTRLSLLALLAGSAGLLAPLPSSAQSVSLNTGSLSGLGTYYLDFQLLDGGGGGDGNSRVTISGLSLAGGSLGLALPSTGTVSGGLTTTLSLKDSDPGGMAEFIQPFTVSSGASLLNFNVGLFTTAPLDAPATDGFNLLVLGSDGVTPLPTQGPTGTELLTSDFASLTPSLTGYSTASGSAVNLTATVRPAAPPPSVPEPGPLALLGLGLPTLALLAWRRRSA